MNTKEHDLASLGKMTEEEAREYLEAIRWPTGAACPHCGDLDVILLRGKSTRPGVYKCRGCRQPFTVTVGTIFEDSHISLSKWVMAFHLMCSSKKGISALQLKRNLGLGSYKSAWHMAHRIRHAMRSEPLASMLRGVVEIDETFVGGKPRPGGPKRKRGKGTTKEPVVVLVERDGRARAYARKKLTARNLRSGLREVIRTNVDPTSRVMTDSAADFKGLSRHFASHETTNHLQGEYVRGDVHSNTAESYFALIKRGVYGTFHHVSAQHLPRYLDEFSFRWDHRKTTDGERTVAGIQGAEGKRLMYAANNATS